MKIDQRTGMVMNLTDLKQIIKTAVMDVMDHKNIDLDVPYFEKVPSTAENIAVFIWQSLSPLLGRFGDHLGLHEIRLHETGSNSECKQRLVREMDSDGEGAIRKRRAIQAAIRISPPPTSKKPRTEPFARAAAPAPALVVKKEPVTVAEVIDLIADDDDAVQIIEPPKELDQRRSPPKKKRLFDGKSFWLFGLEKARAGLLGEVIKTRGGFVYPDVSRRVGFVVTERNVTAVEKYVQSKSYDPSLLVIKPQAISDAVRIGTWAPAVTHLFAPKKEDRLGTRRSTELGPPGAHDGVKVEGVKSEGITQPGTDLAPGDPSQNTSSIATEQIVEDEFKFPVRRGSGSMHGSDYGTDDEGGVLQPVRSMTMDKSEPEEEDSGSDSEKTEEDIDTEKTLPGIKLRNQEAWTCMNPKRNGSMMEEENNQNKFITDEFQRLVERAEADGDQWRMISYRRAINILKKQPRVQKASDVAKIRGIGPQMVKKIDEVLRTGLVRKAHTMPKDHEAMALFTNIYGIGVKIARKLVAKGYKTLDDVRKYPKLTRDQELGLQYYHDFLQRIPRDESDKVKNYVEKVAAEIDPACEITMMGSYRRGAPTSGDIDFIVSHPDNESQQATFRKLYQALRKDGFIVDDLGSAVGLLEHGIYKGGLSLSQHGLFTDVVRNGNREKVFGGTCIASKTEQEIFDALGVPWREPTDRNV
ncbi:hypothetical protein HK101_010674 [Irineochytrium annulatum]|nr:hypothetical protein HK101_010674 [Irineochytrium annulatum]